MDGGLRRSLIIYTVLSTRQYSAANCNCLTQFCHFIIKVSPSSKWRNYLDVMKI